MRTFLSFLILMVLAASLLVSCEDIPDNNVWPPNTANDAPRPVITGITVDPSTSDAAGVAFAGVGIVYISGQNFSSVPSENRVFFDGQQGEVLEAEPTQLKVRVGNVVGDSVKVYVNVKNALQYAEYNGKNYFSPFKLKSAVSSYKAIDQFTDATGLAVDADGSIYYLTTAGKIFKVAGPDSDAVEYGQTSSSFITTSCLRFGPDGGLYLNRKTRTMYKIPAGGGKLARFTTMTGNVAYFDFDANGTMYAGGKDGTIETVLSDATTKKTSATYPDYLITGLRVYDGYVYVSAKYDGTDSTQVQQGIWKNHIEDDQATLGGNELVLDWTSLMGEDGPNIMDFTFDADGEMYIGQDKDGAIYMLNAGDYFYSQILSAPVTKLTWGNDKFLYINQHPDDPAQWATRRVEVTIDGAPYYGRP